MGGEETYRYHSCFHLSLLYYSNWISHPTIPICFAIIAVSSSADCDVYAAAKHLQETGKLSRVIEESKCLICCQQHCALSRIVFFDWCPCFFEPANFSSTVGCYPNVIPESRTLLWISEGPVKVRRCIILILILTNMPCYCHILWLVGNVLSALWPRCVFLSYLCCLLVCLSVCLSSLMFCLSLNED